MRVARALFAGPGARRALVDGSRGHVELVLSGGGAYVRLEPSDWLFSVLLPSGVDRAQVMSEMQSVGVETRPVFYCAHTMPMYTSGESLPISEDIAARGISLPSFPTLADAEIDRVVDALRTALAAQHYA